MVTNCFNLNFLNKHYPKKTCFIGRYFETGRVCSSKKIINCQLSTVTNYFNLNKAIVYNNF